MYMHACMYVCLYACLHAHRCFVFVSLYRSKNPGYLYFADQMSGSYMGWPTLQWCPTNYDPRFRPWYASGSTGPKDVIVVVDVSGSMGAENRYNLARQATRALAVKAQLFGFS